MRKSLLIPVTAVMLSLFIQHPARLTAQAPSSPASFVTWTLPTLTGADTLRLEGYTPSATLTFTLPPGWQASAFSHSGQLTLYYRISDLARAGATLTVRFNEQNLYSAKFISRDGSLTFDLPAGPFRSGRNTVELLAFLPLEEDRDCIVPNHPARWLEFGPTSQISLTVEPLATPLSLADFPLSFEVMGDDSSGQVTFVVPDAPDNQELSALAAVAFVLARESVSQPGWSVVPAGRFDPDALAGPVVLVGVAGRNSYVDQLAPANGGGAGWLSLARPDWSRGQPVLAVGGPDGQAVLQAANALADPLARLKMEGDTVVVDELPGDESQALPEQFTLADLGYSERVARGAGEHSLIYTFDIPFKWSPEDGRLALHFAHSALADPRVASLTVRLNGFTVADIRLDAPESPSDRVEFSAPKRLLRPGRNFLRLAFDFGAPVQLCEAGSAEGPWAAVRPDTTLTLPHGDKGGRISLNDFPYLFASPVDLADLTVALPSESTSTDLADALNLVRVLSPHGSQSPFAPRLALSGSLDAETKQSHLILLGPPSQQPLLTELNPQLHLPFDLESGTLLPTYGIRVPIAAPDLGVVQILRSPWGENRVILVASGTSAAGYQRALQLLTDPFLQPELAGQLALIAAGSTAGGPRVYTQSVADMAAVPAVGTADRALDQSLGADSRWRAPILILAALLVVAIVATLALVWYRRRHRP